jgi:glycosyltransferase involved in cell wall biosynthesis
MASGLPVIATDCIGPKSIIENNGFLIKQKSTDEIVKKLNILIDNPRIREKLGKEGRKLAVTKYDTKTNAKKWLKIFR